MKYRIGIDVGGTNTDAIIIDENNKVVCETKQFTTQDIQTGIENALKELFKTDKVNPSDIDKAMLGTTQCTNAIAERKHLESVVSIRLAGPATHAVRPYTNWPHDILDIVKDAEYIIDGGYEYDGSEITPVNLEQVQEIVKKHQNSCHCYAVSCVFSPIDGTQEQLVRDEVLKLDPNAIISISSEVGSLSLIERENATILNTSLNKVIENVTTGFRQALKTVDVQTDNIYLCQNDGTLMDLDFAKKFPVYTIASGPTNSIRGGIYLTECNDAIIVDVGGTTTDIGIVTNKFPRESTTESEIGGISTNFRMPDIVSIAIGGGTIVKYENDQIVIGPESVGYQLATKALAFGGDTITLSDVAIRLGQVKFGVPAKTEKLSLEFCNQVMDLVAQKINDAIDLLKTSDENTNVVFVGGGSVVIPKQFTNQNNVHIPNNYAVANAIGSSIAQVGGSYEAMVSFDKVDRSLAIEQGIEHAKQNAILAGAREDGLEVVDIEEFSIAYHPENACRLKIKVVGELNT